MDDPIRAMIVAETRDTDEDGADLSRALLHLYDLGLVTAVYDEEIGGLVYQSTPEGDAAVTS